LRAHVRSALDFMPAASRSKKRSAPPSRPVSRNPRDRDAGPDPQADRAPKRAWIFALLLAVIIFAVYSPVLKYPFVNYDDVDYVSENAHVQRGLSLETLNWAITSTQQANWHPLTWLSHALDCDLFGLAAGGHHFTSLLLHAANAVLIFLLLRRVTGAFWRSLLVAAVFALHPTNVESVAWVAERKTVLSMFFFLLTLGAYGWYARRPGIARYAGVFVLFALALTAKPMVVTLPFVLVLLDIWPLRRVQGGFLEVEPTGGRFSVPQFSLRHLLWEKLPLLALSAASSVITMVAQRPALKTMDAIPFGQRVANAVFSYAMYVWRAFSPVRLSVFYAPQGGRLSAWQIVLCSLFLAVLSALVWKFRARGYLLVGWLWFLGTLVPMIGLVQVGEQGMADRYAYLPLLGIFVIVVWLSADVCVEAKINQLVPIAASVAVLITMLLLTWRQIHTWESTLSLWSHSLEITPGNYVAEDSIGTILMDEGLKATGDTCADQALVHFQNAVRIYPQDSLGRLNVGFCQQARGHFEEAIEQYEIALQYARSRYLKSRAYLDLGAAYDDQGLFAQARTFFEQGMVVAPRDPQMQRAMAKVEAEEKVVELSKSVAAHPTSMDYLQMGTLQQELGRIADARASYQSALRLDPSSAQARRALGALETPAAP
jgi:Flp pilus assembly protein TadD